VINPTAPSTITVYPHQVDAIRWMIHQETSRPTFGGRVVTGGILGDDMGLGKTKSFTSLLTLQGVQRTLIIAGKALIYQWLRELRAHDHEVFFMHPDYACRAVVEASGRAVITRVRIAHRDLPANFVGLTTMGMVRPHPELSHSLETATPFLETSEELTPYKEIRWNRVMIDEAHTLRNGFRLACDKGRFPTKKSLKYARCHRLLLTPDGARWGLSGTPLQNRLSDLGSLFLWIGMPVTNMTTMETLQHYIGVKMFRRSADNLHSLTKEVIRFPTIPYEEHRVAVVYNTDKERAFYQAAAGDIAARFAALQEAGYGEVASEDNMLLLLTLLRCLSAHPQMYIDTYNKRYDSSMPDWIGPTSKSDMIEARLRELYTVGESVIVFVRFYEEARQLADRAARAGYETIEFMNGTVEMEDRDWIVESTRQKVAAGVPVIILANIIACGEGLNLQHIHNVIIASPDWNPSNEKQAICRIHRIGQTNLVRVWRYMHDAIMDAGVDIDLYMRKKQDVKEMLTSVMIRETNNAAVSWPAMELPGHPGVKSTVFAPVAPLIMENVERPRQRPIGRSTGGVAVAPVPRGAGLPTDRAGRAALFAAAAERRLR
jgi:SNF2 family DNA or RNA helicase